MDSTAMISQFSKLQTLARKLMIVRKVMIARKLRIAKKFGIARKWERRIMGLVEML